MKKKLPSITIHVQGSVIGADPATLAADLSKLVLPELQRIRFSVPVDTDKGLLSIAADLEKIANESSRVAPQAQELLDQMAALRAAASFEAMGKQLQAALDQCRRGSIAAAHRGFEKQMDELLTAVERDIANALALHELKLKDLRDRFA